MNNDFIIQKPFNAYLQSLVDYYFFIDIPISKLKLEEEYVIPFPRITFGYFFEHPFLVTNHSNQETIKAEMIISRISVNQISVKPLTERVKIIGAHVRPYTLSFLTNKNISEMPWLVKTEELFGENAQAFKERINKCTSPYEMFIEVENIFSRTILAKDLSLIKDAVQIIENQKGNISISTLADKIGVSNRTLRNHFHKSIGCSPKEYINLVKLKQSVYQMKHSTDSLTSVSYSQNYADQAHFTNTFKNITGVSPKKIREKIPDFRFLQF